MGIGSVKPLLKLGECDKFSTPPNHHNENYVRRLSEFMPVRKKLDNTGHDIVPALEWIKMYREGQVTAEVLISAEIKEIDFATNLIPIVNKIPALPKSIQLDVMSIKV